MGGEKGQENEMKTEPGEGRVIGKGGVLQLTVARDGITSTAAR